MYLDVKPHQAVKVGGHAFGQSVELKRVPKTHGNDLM